MPGAQKKWASFVLQPQTTSQQMDPTAVASASTSSSSSSSRNQTILASNFWKLVSNHFDETNWLCKRTEFESNNQYSSIQAKKTRTLPKFNNSPMSPKGGWKTILSYWVSVAFQMRTVKLWGGNSIMSPLPKGHRSKSLLITS